MSSQLCSSTASQTNSHSFDSQILAQLNILTVVQLLICSVSQTNNNLFAMLHSYNCIATHARASFIQETFLLNSLNCQFHIFWKDTLTLMFFFQSQNIQVRQRVHHRHHPSNRCRAIRSNDPTPNKQWL